jgi:hypothetical protein
LADLRENHMHLLPMNLSSWWKEWVLDLQARNRYCSKHQHYSGDHFREQAVTHSIIWKVLPAKHQQSGQVSNIIRWDLTATHHHKVHTTDK